MVKSALVLSIALVAALTTPPSLSPSKKAARTQASPRPWELKIGHPAPDQRFVIEGRVLGRDGRPRRGLRMQVYHADLDGQYMNRTGPGLACSGFLHTNVMGEFRVETELPGMAEGTPHVHFVVEDPDSGYRFATMNLARYTGPGSDKQFERLPWMIDLPEGGYWAYVMRDTSGALRCRWDLLLSKTTASGDRPVDWPAK